MNEWEKFDQSLSDSLETLPLPQEAIEQVTPWREAVERIVTGLVLTTITLNFLCLQYILPAVGALQLYLGFRTLQGNGRWFRISSYLAMCKVFLIYTGTILDATSLATFEPLSNALGWIGAAVTFLLYFCFRKALRTAFRAMGKEQESDPLQGAMIWYVIVLVLALWMPDIGLIGGIFMLIAYGCIIHQLSHVADELEVCGYSVRAFPVRVSSGLLKRCYYLSLIGLVAVCTVFFNHLPVERQPYTPSSNATIEEQLISLGFPEELLSRLDDDELEKLQGADWCSVALDQENGGDREKTKLRFDTVYVRIEDCTYRIYNFFTIEEPTLRSNFQNCVQVNPDYEPDVHPSSEVYDFTCRIFWTSDGEQFYHDPEVHIEEEFDFFGGAYFAPQSRFSYPFFSEGRCGYMAYTTTLPPTWSALYSSFHYDLPSYRNLYPFSYDTATHWYDLYGGSYTSLQLPVEESE